LALERLERLILLSERIFYKKYFRHYLGVFLDILGGGGTGAVVR